MIKRAAPPEVWRPGAGLQKSDTRRVPRKVQVKYIMSDVCGRGSVVQLEKGKPRSRCRKWRLVVSMGVDPVTKKRLPPKTRRFSGTYKEAQAVLRAFIAEIENGPLVGGRMSSLVADWIAVRSKMVEAGSISPGTLRRDKVRARTVARWFGQAAVSDIDSDAVVRFLAALRSGAATLSGKPASGTTARGMAVGMHAIMGYAVERRMLPKNPCDGIAMPKVDTAEKEALRLSQLRDLLVLLTTGEPDARMIGVLLAVTCGLSREELLGLSWRDVDEGTLSVRAALSVDADELAVTKTRKRRRTMPIYPEVLAALESWRAVQFGKLAAMRIVQGPETPIVTNAVGGRMHPENFSRWWRSRRGGMGLEGVGLHQLRHTFATYLASEGVDLITAADLMGHSSTKMLEEVYAHVVPERKVSAMNAVGSLMFGDCGGGIPSGIPKCSAMKS